LEIVSPQINIKLCNVECTGLLDTGSEVNAVSDKLYNELKLKEVELSILPVSNTHIVTACGKKSKRISTQFYCEVNFDKINIHLNFLVIPNLTHKCILGAEALYKLNANLNFKNNLIELRHNDIVDIISIVANDKPINIEINQFSPNIEDEEELYEVKDKNETEGLNAEEKSKFNELLDEFKYLNREEIGLLNTYKHKIMVIDKTPYYRQPYKLKASDTEKANSVIDKWEKEGIIEKSNSCYVNPLVFVNKPNGDVRPCLDARFINSRTVPEFTTPEKIQHVLRSFKNVKYISVLDLRSSFLQVDLDEESRQFTAFKFNHTIYQFTRVPFGLKNSLAAFEKAINPVIPKHLKDNIKNYVDDILILSDNFSSHLFHLRTIFTNLLQSGATLNFSKCNFFKSSVKFVGHIISTNGISKDPEKIQAIRDYPRPLNPKQTQSFLGLLNFYNHFTDKYAEYAAPLNDLIRKNATWKWGEKEENSFLKLKEELSKDINLNSPDYDKQFFIQCDASSIGVGGVLYQLRDNGEKQIIACYSKKLTDREIKLFTVTEKELYSIVIAIRKFYDTISGYKITIISDHQALCHLFVCKNPPPRIHRWILFLQPLNLNFEFIPGIKNQVADVLSRNINLVIKDSDEDIFKRILTEQVYTNEFLDKLNDNFKFENNILYIKLNNNWLIHIPPHLVNSLVEQIHLSYCHIGVDKTFKIIQEKYSCKHLRRIVKKFVKTCHDCQTCKSGPCSKYSINQIYSKEPLDLVSIDYFGPLPMGQYKFKYILVIVDNFSRYVKLYPTSAANLIQTQKRINQYVEFTSNFGKINKILSDNATTFTSDKWTKFLITHNIKPVLTAIRRPQSNLSERINKEIVSFLRILLKGRHNGWVKHLKDIEDCINTTYHSAIDNIPYEVFLGLKPPRPWEKFQSQNLTIPKPEHNKMIESIKQKYKNKSEKLNEINKEFSSKLKIGMLVLIKSCYISCADEARVGKLCPKFDGPFLIHDKLGKNVFVLLHPDCGSIRGIFHSSLLKPYYSRIDN